MKRDLGDAQGMPLVSCFTGPDSPRHIRFIIAKLSANAGGKVCLRAYPIRGHLPSPITVIEAALATCATQPEFAPISVAHRYKKWEYIGAGLGASNPIQELITEAHSLFGGESSVTSVLSLGVGYPGIVSIPSNQGEAGLYSVMRDLMNDCEEKAQEMEQRIGNLGIYSRISVDQGMQKQDPHQAEDLDWIASQTESYLALHEASEIVDRLSQNIGSSTGNVTLDQLKHAAGPPVSSQLLNAVQDVRNILISNQDNSIIAKLKPADLECDSHVTECMKGTRPNILEEIESWAADLEAPNILWLKGYPGVGKSAVSTSLVERWRLSGRLGSSFFFRRESANKMTAIALWRKVAYDLSRRSPSFRVHSVAALNLNESLLSISNVDTLFFHLIQEPLVACDDITVETLPIIVIDALDECGRLDGRYSEDRKGLIRTLSTWSSLPGRLL